MSFHFPPEIEDEIFRSVVCTTSYVPTDVHLAVVSKRVQSIIEPILYETVMLAGGLRDFSWEYVNKIVKRTHEDDFILALHSKPPSFFKKNVKNLFVLSNVSEKFFLDVLSICSNVNHLAVYNSRVEVQSWDLIKAMPLNFLEYGGDFQSVLDQLIESPHIFLQLNYLSISHTAFDEELITNSDAMKYFPELNHFVVRVAGCTAIVNQNLKAVLDNLPRLQSLIILLDEYIEWGNEEFDGEIRKWMELDKRIEVIDSPMLFPQIWKERVTTGRNAFEDYKFTGHHSDDEGDEYYERDWYEHLDDGESDIDEESDDEDY